MNQRKMFASGGLLAAAAMVWIAGCSDPSTQTESSSGVAQRTTGQSQTGAAATEKGMVQTVGLTTGAAVPLFDVLTVSGELKGKSLCYV